MISRGCDTQSLYTIDESMGIPYVVPSMIQSRVKTIIIQYKQSERTFTCQETSNLEFRNTNEVHESRKIYVVENRIRGIKR